MTEPPELPDAPPPLPTPIRLGLQGAGLVFVGLAALGVVLPGLPTTPFLLVAAAAFARSSPRLYQRLLANRVFGPLIRDWRAHRTISRRAKLGAVSSIVLLGGATVAFLVPNHYGKIGLGAIMLTVIVWLVSRPSSR